MDNQFHLTRHSKSNYDEYERVLGGENPHAKFEHQKQQKTDLTAAGIELAEAKSQELFKHMNPQTDRLFFVSSNEARAIGTADIYRKAAAEKGFDIVGHKKTGSKLAEEVGGNEIRVLNTLSLNPKNTLLFHVYSNNAPDINWGDQDAAFVEKWKKARAIIEKNNKGSWGGNFLAYGDEIEKIFPEVESADKFYRGKMLSLLKLIKWANKKLAEGDHHNIKIMAFGHEDYLVKFLQEIFDQEGIQNCETITFKVGGENPDSIVFSARGKIKELDLTKKTSKNLSDKSDNGDEIEEHRAA